MFDLKTFGFDTMLNYHLSQKLKLIGIDELLGKVHVPPLNYRHINNILQTFN
jgi:hypothetical protein